MKLAICIPTHHGRAAYLRELLDSILRQGVDDHIQICISDNASQDGTSELIEQYQRASPVLIKYYRFQKDMRGVRNFLNVVEMADTEYCWLMGSDDVIVDDSLRRILTALKENPSVAGMTVNKLNFDKSLDSFIGPDHDIVLPFNPMQTRFFDTFEQTMVNLGMHFTYMSAHIFRRDGWSDVVKEYGVEYLLGLRHFPHSFIFLQIAKKYGAWLWIADYCVIQRLGNFCVMEEKGGRSSLYATEVTEDLEKVWSAMLGPSDPAYSGLMRKLFILYWNPWLIVQYKCERNLSVSEERVMRNQTVRRFRGIPLFWIASYPLIVAPAQLIRPVKKLLDWMYRVITSHQIGMPLRSGGRMFFHAALRLLRIENGQAEYNSAAKIAAERHKERVLEGIKLQELHKLKCSTSEPVQEKC